MQLKRIKSKLRNYYNGLNSFLWIFLLPFFTLSIFRESFIF